MMKAFTVSHSLISSHLFTLLFNLSFSPLGVWCMPFTRKLHRDDEVSVSNFPVLQFAEDSQWNERTKGKMREKGGGRWLDDETDGRKLIFSFSCLSKTLQNWKDRMSPKIGERISDGKFNFLNLSTEGGERLCYAHVCLKWWDNNGRVEDDDRKGKVERRLDFPSFLPLTLINSSTFIPWQVSFHFRWVWNSLITRCNDSTTTHQRVSFSHKCFLPEDHDWMPRGWKVLN